MSTSREAALNLRSLLLVKIRASPRKRGWHLPWIPIASAVQEFPGCREGLLLAPGFECLDLSLIVRDLQLVDPIGQIAQRGERLGPLPMADAARVFSQRHIAPIVGSVLDRRPVPTDDISEVLAVILVHRETAGVVADLQTWGILRLGQIDRESFNRDDLPAPAQTNLLRRDGNPSQTSPV